MFTSNAPLPSRLAKHGTQNADHKTQEQRNRRVDLSGGQLEERCVVGLPRRASGEIQESGARVDGKLRKNAVGAVVESGIAPQKAEGDAHNESQASGDYVSGRSDPLGSRGHAPSLRVARAVRLSDCEDKKKLAQVHEQETKARGRPNEAVRF